MPAREDFLRRIRALERAVHEPHTLLLLQHDPVHPEKDEIARLFRNGLAVSAFAILEDFIKARTREVLDRLSGSVMAFAELPENLQTLCTEGVVSALRFQVDMRTRTGEDVAGLIRDTAAALASTNDPDYVLSGLAFGHGRSNLTHNDVNELLAAFNIPDGWGNATRLSRRMGFASLSLRDDFQSAARRRHVGAHVAGAEIPLVDLQALPAQILAIAAGCDGTLSRAAYRLLRGDRHFSQSKPSLDESEIALRFLHEEGSVTREIAEGRRRATARGSDTSAMLASCEARAARTGAIVVITSGGIPNSWLPTDLGPSRP